MKPRILFISDYLNLNSGFANVIRKIIYYFYNLGYTVAQMGWAYTGFPPSQDPFPVYPISSLNQGDYFGSRIFENVVEHFKPDVVFTLGDCYAIDWLVGHPSRKYFKLVSYVPIDSHPIPSVPISGLKRGWVEVLESVDQLILMSNYGLEQVKKVCSFKQEPVVIYHGVDDKVFYPGNKFLERGRQGFDLIETIYSCVATNSERKQIPRLLEAFKIVSDTIGTDKVALLLHVPVREQRDGWFLDQIVSQLDLFDDKCFFGTNVYFTGKIRNGYGTSANIVRRVYTISDVFVTPTTCEGFGLPILEAAACERPTIGINYSTLPELVGDHGWLVEPSDWIYTRPYCMKRPLISIKKLAESMIEAHLDKDKTSKFGKLSFKFAKKYTWDKVLPSFEKVIRDTIGR